MKKSLHRLPKKILPVLLLMLGMASSCNSKEEKKTDTPAVTISTVAIKSFNLKADTKVLNKLDSVFFSIDLKNGVIFNADSLPKGTKISRLIPVITFQTGMSEATIVMEGGSDAKTDTINYLTNPTDSVDFSKKVSLKVTAADGVNKYTYRIKVNVHTQEPDSLMWDKLAVTTLPSRMASPITQKSVDFKGKAFSLIKENDNSLTLSTSDNLFKGEWKKQPLSLPFEPDVRSLEATSEALYLLAADGTLFSSSDGIDWKSTSEKWTSIIGPYLDCILGIKSTSSGLMHCHYPASSQISDTAVNPDFPIEGRSSFKTISTKWSPYPTGFFVGGTKASGDLSAETWAFDGSRWAVISNSGIVPVDGATLVKYVCYRNTGKPFVKDEFDAWLVIGGRKADGTCNRTLFISFNNGVTWQQGSTLMQLPDYFPGLSSADGIVANHPLNADLADAWKETPSRNAGKWLKPAYTTDGFDITWQCPYIYIIGGRGNDNALSDAIWRGVLARLEFTPII